VSTTHDDSLSHVAEPLLPAFDLVLATVGRVDEPGNFFASLERQTHRGFRVLLVDQNEDDRLGPVLEAYPGVETVRLRSGRGLSRARNAALPHLAADIVAFPDDDCVYADDLLERVGRGFVDRQELDGLTGRAVDAAGRSSPSWEREAAVLSPDNLWNRAISFAIFLRRRVLTEVGTFDEQLGLGAPTPWFSGEEIDYLVRAVLAGARIEYDPDLTVTHDEKAVSPDGARTVGCRDGASVGYILRKHRYPRAVLARMLFRPLGGVLFSAARGDVARARFHAATLRGRLLGYGGGGRSRGR
jgi:GT2 family glycosyltransferase